MIYKDTLPSGLRVITMEMPYLYSVTAGIWVSTGSCYETDKLAGVSHFLEHMLFKGTEKRNSREIAEALEAVGGQMNAFTSKENTCYYIKVLGEHFPLGMDILGDMYRHSTFLPEEFQRERGVILEEINMYEDNPDDLVGEIFNQVMWPEHPYGLPIIGTTESVGQMERDDMVAYYQKTYVPAHTVVVVAGNIKREQVLSEVAKALDGVTGQWEKPLLASPVAHSGQTYTYKDIEQAHICLGVPGIAGDDPDLYVLNVLVNALGGGVSSRLFQEAREKRGLAYSIYAYTNTYIKGGNVFCYASASPKKAAEALKIMGHEMADIAAHGLQEKEINCSKEQLKGGLLLSMESTASLMNRLGKLESNYGQFLTVEEAVEKVMAVTAEDVRRVAAQLFVPEKLVFSQVGPAEMKVNLGELF